MTLMQLRYFCEVAQTRNFTAAAKNLYVAQSSISVAIRELESELGLPLFIRGNKRKIELSSFGEQLYPYVSESLSTLDKGLSEVLRGQNDGTVTIGCFVNATHSLIPWFLKDFAAVHHDRDIHAVLEVHHTYTDLYSKLVRGDYDLAVSSCEEPIEFCASELIAIQPIRLLVPASHRFAFRSKVSLADIKDEPLLCVTPDSYMDIHIRRMFKDAGLQPGISYSPDYSALAADVAMGKGIAMVTKMPVDDNLLSYVDIDEPNAKRRIHLSWPTNRKLSEATNLVLGHILQISRKDNAQTLVF